MFQDRMLKYFQTLFELITRTYGLAKDHNDPDGVHDLRVGLKRMKALFNLVGTLNSDFTVKKRFKEFKSIAKNSCLLRDSQVQKMIAGKVKTALDLDISGYESYLSGKEQGGIAVFQTFAAAFRLDNLMKSGKQILNALNDLSPVRAETKAFGRVFNLRNELVLAGNGTLLEDRLHTLRILSKETHYTFEIVDQCFHPLDGKNGFIQSIKRVHAFLGDWHDYEIGLGFLKDFMESDSSEVGDGQCSAVKKYFQNVKTSLKKQLPAALNDLEQASKSIAYIKGACFVEGSIQQ